MKIRILSWYFGRILLHFQFEIHFYKDMLLEVGNDLRDKTDVRTSSKQLKGERRLIGWRHG
ncbi:hypothetical protein EEX84_11320 [Planococcus salinus]|uniref:Uncharacterized protein n=1 Tax=Planococcus salinus TaxID=1848460 RepID=A0A3M8P5M4_9BACL|nr:hypothetical protein EEX84_11320 [Planococcus salinus]